MEVKCIKRTQRVSDVIEYLRLQADNERRQAAKARGIASVSDFHAGKALAYYDAATRLAGKEGK